MVDPQVAYDKLASLESPEEIASFFAELNIKGHPSQAQSCAISNYMREMTGHSFMTAFSVEDITGYKEWDLTAAMDAFMTEFDAGEFPELISPPEPS